MQEKGLISVCIPNYNDADSLGEILDAILAQTYKNYEVILVDDGSTDNSIEIIQSYLPRFEKITFIQHPKNLGVNATLYTDFKQVRGEWIYYGSANDRLESTFFEKAMRLVFRFPKAGFCAAEAEFVYLDRRDKSALNFPEGFISSGEYFEAMEALPRGFVGQSCLYRRDFALDKRFFAPELKWMTDTIALSNLAFRYGFCFIKESMSIIEMRKEGFSSKRKTWKEYFFLFNQVLNYLSHSNDVDVKPLYIRSGWFCTIGWRFLIYLLFRPAKWKFFSRRYFVNLIRAKWGMYA